MKYIFKKMGLTISNQNQKPSPFKYGYDNEKGDYVAIDLSEMGELPNKILMEQDLFNKSI
jgi:hypothetical protein